MRVLIAEDEPDIREILRESISALGHSCVVAPDGQAAWELFQAEGADTLITDWLMPRMTGLDLCQHIRELDEVPYVYIIMLTALADESHLIQGMEAGADDYFAKPFSLGSLQARLITAERVLTLQRRREIQLRLSRRLSDEPNPEALVRTLVEEAIQLVGADAGGVFISSEDDELVTWHAESVVARGIRERLAVQRAVETLTEIDSTRTVVLSNYQSQVLPESAEHMAAVQSAIATPLLRDGQLLGTLVVVKLEEDNPLAPRDGESLETLAGLGIAALTTLERTELAQRVAANRTADQELDNSLGPTAAFSALLAGDARLPADLRNLATDVMQGVETALRSVRARLAPPSGDGSNEGEIHLPRRD